MPTTFVLLRHAQGTHNVDSFKKGGRHYNDPVYLDAELTREGIQQAIQTREKLKDYYFDAIYCSPLRRCRSTLIGVIPSSPNLPVILDDRLLEQPYGENICDKRLEREEVVRTSPTPWIADKVAVQNPFTELSYVDNPQRSFTSEVRRKFPEGTVLVVSHSEWIRRWMRMFQMKHAELGNCEYIEVTL